MKPLIAAALGAACLALGACATGGPPPAPKVEPKPYVVKVHEPCQVAEPGQPDWADSTARIKGAPGPDAVAGAYAAGRKQHYRYEAELRTWGEGCAK